MTLAKKISKLRNDHDLTQERLSEIVDVSELTIRKWESGQAEPRPDHLAILSREFGVSFDDSRSEVQHVSYYDLVELLEKKHRSSKLIAKGVMLCISSIVPLMLLLAFSDQLNMTTDLATTSGLILLFVMIAIAVGIFIRANMDDQQLDDKMVIDQSTKDKFREQETAYRSVYTRNITIAITMILLSTLPLIAVSILVKSGFLALLMIVLKLLLISLGVMIIIPTSNHYNTLKAISKIGDNKPQKSREEKRTEKIAAFYWPLVLAIYLGWSLWTMAWGTTWIVWPVGAILFIAAIGFVGLFDK